MIDATRIAGSRRDRRSGRRAGRRPRIGTKTVARRRPFASSSVPGGRPARRPWSRTHASSSSKAGSSSRRRVADRVGRHALGLGRPDDDVGLARDLDVEARSRRRPRALALQLRAAAVEDRWPGPRRRRRAGDLGERHADVAQGEDPPQLRQLGRRVVAVAGRRVDPRRAEQPAPRPTRAGVLAETPPRPAKAPIRNMRRRIRLTFPMRR